MDVAVFKSQPILGILRGIPDALLETLIETIIRSGLRTIEITMNTQGAPAQIRRARAAADGALIIGAGTVLSVCELEEALEAGASFIVMPVVVDEVMDYCVKKRIPVFPGALTPTEVFAAHRKAATMVKVFPSGCFGAEYFRELKGPFADIELLACGGVKPDNVASYFACGASAVSFGASVFRKEWLLQKDFASIERSIREFLAHLPHEH